MQEAEAAARSEPVIQSFDAQRGLLTLTLNRPSKKNALDQATKDALLAGIQHADANPEVRVVALTANGDVFSAGGDINAMQEFEGDPQAPLDLLRNGINPLVLAIHDLPKPVIARVDADAHGAGAALAFQCDLTLAADDARFALAFRHLGLIPDTGATWILPRFMGLQRAKYHVWTGAPFTAQQAADWGLILDAVPRNQLQDQFSHLVDALAAGPAAATGLSKRALHANLRASLPVALEKEAQLQARAAQTPDHHEGRRAFLEKRRPQFR